LALSSFWAPGAPDMGWTLVRRGTALPRAPPNAGYVLLTCKSGTDSFPKLHECH
jgi:hypothetical protein